jgi:Chaperone of endosialidase
MSVGGGGKGGSQPSGYTTTTQTQNTAPWSVQQPYLQQAFGGAQNLYQNYVPQYYPGSTYAPPNSVEYNANTDLWNQANSLLTGANPTLNNALNFSNYLETGGALQNNPAINPLLNMSGSNIGLNNPGTGTLENLAGGNLSGYQLPQNALTALGLNNAAYNNPAFGSLAGIAAGGAPGVGTAGNLALGSIGPSQGTLAAGLGPGMADLGSFASGSQTDPFLSSLAQSTLASVLPSIQSQFINGGDLSSPQAAYASSQGASAALAPILSNALLAEQQNQLQAGQALGNLGISGANALQGLSLNPAALYGNLGLQNAGLQANAGQALGSQILQGQGLQQSGLGQAAGNALNLGGLQSGAASNLGNLALGRAGLQTTQLGNVGNLYNQGIQQQLQGLALLPQTEQSMFAPAQTEFGAGQNLQNFAQNTLNADVNRYNYYQTLPYQQLAQYLGAVSGNYGGTSTGTTSSPYYINQGANLLSGALGGGMLGSQLFPGLGATDTTPTILGLGGENLAFPTASGGFGGLAGAGLGSLLAFLSDRRLKRDIEKVGELHNGLAIYRFRFWGDAREHIGLMADEVRKVLPEAVIPGPYGFDLVDYGQALSSANDNLNYRNAA